MLYPYGLPKEIHVVHSNAKFRGDLVNCVINSFMASLHSFKSCITSFHIKTMVNLNVSCVVFLGDLLACRTGM